MRTQQDDDEVNVDVHVASDWPKDFERRSLSGGMMIISGITGERCKCSERFHHGRSGTQHAMHVTFTRTCVLNLNTTLGGPRAAKLKPFSSFVRA